MFSSKKIHLLFQQSTKEIKQDISIVKLNTSKIAYTKPSFRRLWPWIHSKVAHYALPETLRSELYHVSWWYWTLVIDLTGQLSRDVIGRMPVKPLSTVTHSNNWYQSSDQRQLWPCYDYDYIVYQRHLWNYRTYSTTLQYTCCTQTGNHFTTTTY